MSDGIGDRVTEEASDGVSEGIGDGVGRVETGAGVGTTHAVSSTHAVSNTKISRQRMMRLSMDQCVLRRRVTTTTAPMISTRTCSASRTTNRSIGAPVNARSSGVSVGDWRGAGGVKREAEAAVGKSAAIDSIVGVDEGIGVKVVVAFGRLVGVAVGVAVRGARVGGIVVGARVEVEVGAAVLVGSGVAVSVAADVLVGARVDVEVLFGVAVGADSELVCAPMTSPGVNVSEYLEPRLSLSRYSTVRVC